MSGADGSIADKVGRRKNSETHTFPRLEAAKQEAKRQGGNAGRQGSKRQKDKEAGRQGFKR
jgi:hypothetical protein